MNNLKKSIFFLAGILLTMSLSVVASAADYPWNYTNPGDAAAVFGLGLAACAIIVIIWFIVWILVAIWVYRDAEKRGKSGALWLIIVILLGIIGLIIWLVVRGDIGSGKAGGRRCPNCGREIPEDALTCPYCGKKFDGFPK